MSASPATPTGPSTIVRKKPKVNIFAAKSKPVRKPAAKTAPRPAPAAPAQIPNGFPTNTQQKPAAAPEKDNFDEYPIVISRRALEAGQRYHALKLQTRPDSQGNPTVVDPYSEKEFTRPLRLHRRYARDKMEVAESEAASGVDDKEREQMNARRAERQAEREENQKLIAPTGGDSSKPMKKKPQKKVEEGRDESNPVRKKRQQLRYEEARPWHLEDFEGKNVWVGSYEDTLSERSIMLEVAGQGFKLVPVEKWYKFTQVNKVNAMTAEEVEKHLSKKVSLPRWAMGTQKLDTNEIRKQEQRRVNAAKRKAEQEDDDDKQAMRFTGEDGEFQADKDMLDMEFNDEFQDDDEGMLFQGEDGEDGKEIEQRLWLEMRDAGLGGTGFKNEDIDPEEEERKRLLEEQEEKKKQKKLKKQLMKREHKGEYESDTDNPYGSSSDSEDSDQEREKDEEQKKQEEEAKKAALLTNGDKSGDKSGASSRGTNTPTGRREKRPNPDASDLSGNESSRKKAKGINGQAVSTGGRSLSPDVAKKPKGSGSGSDTDTSRTGRPKVAKPKASPNGSRAASPSNTGSRAQSPKPSNGSKGGAFPTLQEVRAAIPPEGIEIKSLVALFKGQVAGRGGEFITLVKTAGVQNKATGRIMPKDS